MRCGWRSWRWSEGWLGLDWGGSSSRGRPTFFASPKKVGKERRPRDARPSAACGAGGPLCFSPARAVPETRVSCAAAQTTGPDCPRAGCDARRALRGGKPAKRGGQRTESIGFKWTRCFTNGVIIVCCFGALPHPRVVPALTGSPPGKGPRRGDGEISLAAVW